ncbi:MAG: hypothetical protein IT357_03545 [Gemmatimonadaceae bacterium]|jgi:hypothetical protein|nr:hypothetical protein [Gemmatimonadaceae bacterium]
MSRFLRSLPLLALVFTATAVDAQAKKAEKKITIPKVEFPTDSSGKIIFAREVYGYPRDGRRDPFASLIATGDIRPLFDDLRVTSVMYDPSGRTSMAMLKDVSTNEIYKVRVGSVAGRNRITYIRTGVVGVAIDEFGFTRQEELTLNVPSGGRTP